MPEDPKRVDNDASYGFLFSVEARGVSPDQCNHISEIGKQFCILMANKYAAGQREHGGNLWDLPVGQLLDNAIDEAIDQVVYLLTIKGKLNGIRG